MSFLTPQIEKKIVDSIIHRLLVREVLHNLLFFFTCFTCVQCFRIHELYLSYLKFVGHHTSHIPRKSLETTYRDKAQMVLERTNSLMKILHSSHIPQMTLKRPNSVMKILYSSHMSHVSQIPQMTFKRTNIMMKILDTSHMSHRSHIPWMALENPTDKDSGFVTHTSNDFEKDQ